MSPITTHVLDTSEGRPAEGVGAALSVLEDGEWRTLGEGRTNADGRIAGLLPEGADLRQGTYRIRFETGEYFGARDRETFYPHADIVFRVEDPGQHYHVPLLVSPFGYSTYRGS